MIDRTLEWEKTKQTLFGLYPNWEASREQGEAWKAVFGMVNPEWLREAIQNVYCKYSSNEPKPKWIHEALREVKAARTNTPIDEQSIAAQKQNDRITVSKEDEETAIADQHRMQVSVLGWDSKTRIHWAEYAMNKYKFLQKYDATKPDTWSKTFCGYIHCLRTMKENAA